MANAPSHRSPGHASTSNPPYAEMSSPQSDKSHVPPPPTLAVPAGFAPPVLQQDQVLSAAMKTANLQSPTNGVKSGSPISHLSTPPGPPVFVSPVRPAAVPFRTSPATPQPVAFSSGSSLPTSSPSLFSNGSGDLQHQIPDVIEETTPAGESACVVLSAHKVPVFLNYDCLFVY